MIRAIAICLLLLTARPGHAGATWTSNCFETFYQTKSMLCIDEGMKGLLQAGAVSTAPSGAPKPGLVGFFAEIFHQFPQEKSRLLSHEQPTATKTLFIAALLMSNRQEDAGVYASANGLIQTVQAMHGQIPLDQLKPTTNPADNDTLIGAYIASGNTIYIQRILGNFSSADDSMVRDALRIGLMNGKFGPPLAAPGRKGSMMQVACQKYECRNNISTLMRVMTMASGFWAAASLSQKDAGIKRTFDDFIEHDPRFKSLLLVERNAFSNYLTELALHSGVPDTANVETALSIYEGLGPAQDAAAAMNRR
jgi:hypothetical protein